MKTRTIKFLVTHVWLLALGAVLSLPAIADQPWVSIPSTPGTDNKVQIAGGNLPEGSAVTVDVQYPDGKHVQQVEPVDATGSFHLQYVPVQQGGYSINVYNSAGTRIGSGSFGYSAPY